MRQRRQGKSQGMTLFGFWVIKHMDAVLNKFTKTIFACLLISVLLHVVLYASDSEDYRRWVTIQIALQIMGLVLLFFVIRRSLIALILFVIISVPFIYINAMYVNYANEIANMVSFLIFWSIYGYILIKGWSTHTPNNESQPAPASGAAEV